MGDARLPCIGAAVAVLVCNVRSSRATFPLLSQEAEPPGEGRRDNAMEYPGVQSLALGLCLCLLYTGYELARASSLALFARSAAADGLSGAYTACGGFVLSVLVFSLYGRGVEVLGERLTLFLSAGGSSVVFLTFATGLSAYGTDAIPSSLVASLFACRESYVTLIGTQVWALLSSELKKKGPATSRSWFCLIQGVSCMCSAFSGMAAGRMATAGGHVYLLVATALSLGVIAATVAFTSGDMMGGGALKGKGCLHEKRKRGGLLRVLGSSASLFRRSPLLAALLAEAMVCQILTATLNMSFNQAIRESLVSQGSAEPPARAAGFVGKSFAFIGLLSGALQLIVMPWAMLRVNPAVLLKSLPLIAGSGFLMTFCFPGFRTATAAFAVTKILDYSVRGTALELVYQPMPDDERLLGKEAIATVGVRIGRTVAHVTLYLCSSMLGGDPPQRVLMGVALVAAVLWAVALRKVELVTTGEGLSPAAARPKSTSNGNGSSVRSPTSKNVDVDTARKARPAPSTVVKEPDNSCAMAAGGGATVRRREVGGGGCGGSVDDGSETSAVATAASAIAPAAAAAAADVYIVDNGRDAIKKEL